MSRYREQERFVVALARRLCGSSADANDLDDVLFGQDSRRVERQVWMESDG